MKLLLCKRGDHPTVDFAFHELCRYLTKIDGSLTLETTEDASANEAIAVGLDGSILPSPEDEIKIDVKNGKGVITASNERALLIAVYRFLREIGCRFLFPGNEGERIPALTLTPEALTVHAAEKASYHHRAVCIEGAVSYDHVYHMIDWLPKVGMNGYYFQFLLPKTFFIRWYEHECNDTMEKTPITEEDVLRFQDQLVGEIKKRGLLYHAVGHSWTCEPFGIRGTGWGQSLEEIPPETRRFFAEVDGKRELWRGIGLNTNLCYSNPAARNRVTDAIVSYCKEHPAVDYLHFWLADDSNNQCECPSCRKMRPSDFYVMMLNELDEKLTAEGISAKIVFLIYVDLLWAPETLRIQNPDRFVLMFAPITRTYSKAFADYDAGESAEEAPFVRNRLTMPRSVGENMGHLSRWQEQFKGDSFDFDYHLMWDHLRDPGYYECARILHTDMVNLEKLGLNGMLSCQLQRAAFPTGLPMYAMAAGLWDKTSSFEDVAVDYFASAFGEDGKAVEEYLKTLSSLFLPPYLRRELPAISEEAAASFAKIRPVVEDFRDRFLVTNENKNFSWKALAYHADYCLILADLLLCRARGEKENAEIKAEEFCSFLKRTEPILHPLLDVWNATHTLVYGEGM